MKRGDGEYERLLAKAVEMGYTHLLTDPARPPSYEVLSTLVDSKSRLGALVRDLTRFQCRRDRRRLSKDARRHCGADSRGHSRSPVHPEPPERTSRDETKSADSVSAA